MAKIALIGAGSVVFAKNLIGDILLFPELADCHIALMDLDPARLHTAERMTQKVAAALHAQPTISAHTDRRAALTGADYVINTIQVGGYRPATVIDFEVPKRHHLHQTIADTLGIGGIMRALRTIPVLIDICRDMEEVCPRAWLLNYTNPMAMNCWALSRATPIRTVGLCHSVQGTAMQLAGDIGVPYAEISYLAAGINHMAFYLRFERQGEDLYPLIRRVVAEGRIPSNNRVRYEMLQRLGYFVTESSEHFAEYTPYFIRRDRPDLIERFNVPLDEYITRCEFMDQFWGNMQQFFEGAEPIADLERSHEYGALIIHSLETNSARVVYGNVPNRGLITNLQAGCCVEVPCLVDGNGIQPTAIGDLPPQLAGLIMTNVNVQALAVEAALTGKREHVYHAAMLDPHTAAELTLDGIWALVDELIAAHGDWLPPLR
ncbi:MAG: alpha-glucosidase/alpha-galactosidase [Deltaproteobacteria bacterium]|nr:alpha-glucosidase/alpha-galactosidase [Deltaproteobacteria bacterium]